MDISGKVALVTGGASGIGKVMVEMLLQKHAKVVYLADINEGVSKQIQEELHQKYGDGKVRLFKCDASRAEEMEACFKEIKSSCGALHIVCNNAGIYNEVNWQRMLEINLNGVVIGTKLAVEYMDGESAGGGVIINVASVAGLALIPFGGLYSTSKYAVIGFTRMTANFDPLVVKKKLRVNVLCPPCTDTPLVNGGLVPEPRYQKGCDDLFGGLRPYMTADDLVKHWVKLIEEPHNGQAMFVQDADTSHLIEDQTQTFRETFKLNDMFTDLVKGVADSM
ncbi:15-hydroxyprostaglandin dehydrogenase [NAD(+)]-like isoform X1 [Amphiura filiformis]|uniref:15-hydroxyprostaglandin dehydrogenase [NAD(+)]-like isoform X1 n=1 Tax=Amphiura filiformis TaxID=82378 RepID=UPI003B20FB0C